MATAALPDRPDLDQLRRRARELQRSARAGEPAALELLGLDRADTGLALGTAQRALARRYGFASWARLKRHVEQLQAWTWTPGAPGREPPADRFLRLACLTYDADSPCDPAAARAVLAEHPEVGRASIGAAAVAGDVPTLRELLGGAQADAPTGPYGWPALMYVGYARVDVGRGPTIQAAELLLRAGADPNCGRYFSGLPAPFTALTGTLGGGERGERPHPHALPLARLLLAAGADPNDAQALYNRQFETADDFLPLLFEFGLGRGDGGPWRRRLPDLATAPGELVRGLLGWAVLHNQRSRVELLAAHGIDVVSALPAGAAGAGRTPIEVALANGHTALAQTLRRLGAAEPAPDPVDSFIGAALAADATAAASTAKAVIARARRRRPGLVVWAAANSGAAAVTILLDAGFAVDAMARGDVPVEQPWQTALHSAVDRDDADSVRLLLSRGADPTIRDARFGATAAQWAEHLGHRHLLDLFPGDGPGGPDPGTAAPDGDAVAGAAG